MKRDTAIDNLRSAVTVAVVAHHAALAYTTFSRYDPAHYTKSTHPVVDAARFPPLDVLVGWNDLFFMALMFLISGLFVGPSIGRKGPGRFLADRAKRLGIPFLFAAAVLGPLASYPSWLLSDAAGQGGFLARFFTVDEGSAGPAWFIWVLLAFSAVAALACAAWPGAMKRLSWQPRSAWPMAGVFLAVSVATIIPPYLTMPGEWLRVAGPVSLPAWRWPLYLAWFTLGIALGNPGPGRSLAPHNLGPWPLWLALGALAYLAHATLATGAHTAGTPAWAATVLLSAAFACCCTFTSLGAVGLARSWLHAGHPLTASLSANAYGVYLFHYAFVTWAQFGLLPLAAPAAAKFLATFLAALAGSWLLTALLRRTAAARVL